MVNTRKCSKKTAAVESRPVAAPLNLLSSASGANKSGLAVFPDELLLEIMSHYPPLPLPIGTASEPFVIDASVARREMLLALSRTCSNLRRFFRPYAWQRIEVCRSMVVDGLRLITGGNTARESKAINLELVRQLEIVTIRDPGLAEFVQIVNVEIMDVSIDSVLRELARCMALFPNLHTVKLSICFLYGKRPRDTPAKNAFKKYTYPQIQNLLLEPPAYPLMLSCNHVRSIHGHFSSAWWKSQRRYSEYAASAASLEDVGFRFAPHSSPDLCLFPNLRIISCDMSFYYPTTNKREIDDFFYALSKLSRLKTIRAWVVPAFPRYAGPTTEEILTRLKKILLNVQKEDHEDKTIVCSALGSRHTQVIQLPFSRSAS